MKVYFASDHAGFTMKEDLLVYVRDDLGYTVEDCGAYTLSPDDDYPEIIARAARHVAREESAYAVVLGGSGQGEAIMANRFKGVRSVVYYGGNPAILRLSREHNNANILSLGARFLSSDEAKHAVKTWLTTAFTSDPRHVRRIETMDALETS